MRDPFGVLVRVPALGPAPEHTVEPMVALRENCFRDDRSIVIGPALDNWIELSDHPFLGGVSLFPHDLPHLCHMPFDGLGTGFNERLKAKRDSSPGSS